MKTTHTVVITDEYLAEAQRVAIAQNRTLRLLYQNRWVWWLPRIGLAAFLIFMIVNRYLEGIIIFGGFLVLSFFGEIFGRRSLARGRGRNAMKGSTTTFSMDEQGLSVVGPNSAAEIRWPAVVRAITYPQGVVLRMQSGGFMWLPDQSLTEGSPEDLRQLLSKQVKDCSPTQQ
jgi:hypothetical protein